jgi:hypothetical protein
VQHDALAHALRDVMNTDEHLDADAPREVLGYASDYAEAGAGLKRFIYLTAGVNLLSFILLFAWPRAAELVPVARNTIPGVWAVISVVFLVSYLALIVQLIVYRALDYWWISGWIIAWVLLVSAMLFIFGCMLFRFLHP